MGKRLLSIMLTVVLAVGLLPLPAYAGDLPGSGFHPIASLLLGAQGTGGDSSEGYAILYRNGDLVFQHGSAADGSEEHAEEDVEARFTGFENAALEVSESWRSGEYGSWLEKIYFADEFKPTDPSFKDWFKDLGRLKTLDLRNLDTSAIKDFSGMFYGMWGIEIIGLDGLDTSNATNMSHMFEQFYPAQGELVIDGWDVGNVENTSDMFSLCWAKAITLSNMRFESLRNADRMFCNCSDAERIDLLDCEFAISESAADMFEGCESLKGIDLSGFDVSKAKNLDYMFQGCSSLKSLDLSHFDLSSYTGIFYLIYCDSIEELNLTGFDNSNGLKNQSGTIGTEFFEFVPRLSKVTFDGEASFDESARDYMPKAPQDDVYTGRWIRTSDGAVTTPEGMCDLKGSSIAGTWVWQRKGQTETKSLEGAIIDPLPEQTYTGSPIEPSVTVKLDDKTLGAGSDYQVTYKNNVGVGTATATITGKGIYTGARDVRFGIAKASLKTATVDVIADQVWTGAALEPSVTVRMNGAKLAKDKDYDLEYKDNSAIGKATVTATGKGGYCDAVTSEFSIVDDGDRSFRWNEDNWNFLNSSRDGSFAQSRYIDQINGTYLKKLKDGLSNCEYADVFDPKIGFLYDDWGGSCHGMSSLELISQLKAFPYGEYGSNAACLHDLAKPTSSESVSSLITYYQMLQMKDVQQQQFMSTPKNSHRDNIKKILSLLDENGSVLVGFRQSGFGGHSVFAIGYDKGTWTYRNKTYQCRIKICDPNASTAYNEYANIYFNTKTYDWVIPLYGAYNLGSENGAVFNMITSSLDEVNFGGFLKGGNPVTTDNYITRAIAWGDNYTVQWTKVAGSNGNYNARNFSSNEITEGYDYRNKEAITGDEIEDDDVFGKNSTLAWDISDSNSSWKGTRNGAGYLDLEMKYSDTRMEGASNAGKSVLFDRAGRVELESEASPYYLAMTCNDSYPTDWFGVSVEGPNAKKIALQKTGDGYVVSGDNLENVVVEVHNKDISNRAKFSTDKAEALIYEIDQATVGVKVDSNENGKFDSKDKDIVSEASSGVSPEMVIALIDKIRDVSKLTLASEAAVKAARVAYDSLTEAQQKSLPSGTLEALQAAEKRVKQLKSKDLSSATITVKNATYNAKAYKPTVTVKLGSKTLKSNTDYTVTVFNKAKTKSVSAKNVGTYYVKIKAKGSYTGTEYKPFKITQAKQPMKVSVNSKRLTAKASSLKRGPVTLTKAITVSKQQGKLTYKKASSPKAVKRFKVQAGGKVVVPKGTKAGAYTLNVKVSAAGTSNYLSGSKTVKLTIRVK